GEVIAAAPEALVPRRGDVVWVNARIAARAITVREAAARAGAPVVTYHPSAGSGGRSVAGDDGATGTRAARARLAWESGGDAFMPPGVLTLGDIAGLGAGAGAPMPPASVRADTARFRPMAWAAVDGARLPLLWRAPADVPDAAAGYGVALPPLWAAGFRPGASASVGATTAAAWVRGLAAWVAAEGAVRV